MKKKRSINKKLIRRIVLLSTLSVFTILGIVLLIVKNSIKVVAESFFPYTESYESTQSVITSSTKSNNLVSMTDANALGTVASGKVVTISTPAEFQLFSNRCETTSAFLGYDYVLMTDIDFAGTGIQDIIPIGYSTAFSGTFNGNGYEISNLPLLGITGNSNTNYQFTTDAEKPIQYLALFSKNSGTIANLGIKNPEITASYVPTGDGLAYVAPFVGLNTGIVHHCYTKETRDRTINNTGIYTLGGFYVSGFASINNGTMHDVYTSRTILSTSNSQNVIAQAEIINDGTSAPTAAYFYDSTITSYTGSNGNDCTILFNDNFVNQNIINVTHYGIYEQSIRQLTIDVVSNDTESTKQSVGSWYNLSSYSLAAQVYFKDEAGDWIYGTPIARGIVTESNLTFTVSNDREFSYMYELFALNKSFATSVATFKIIDDIDMGAIYAPKYYISDIGANIVGAKNNVAEAKITIYNAPIKDFYAKTLGIDCFGVFPWLTGNVSHIDVVLGSSSQAYNFTFNRNGDTNKLSIGAISGYVDGGTIENCNVYINVSFDNAIGKYYFGGISGMIGSTSTQVGVVRKSTVNGNISQTNTTVGTATETVNYLDGMVIGGAVGYLDYTSGSVDEVLSKADITSTGVTGKALSIGGVIGAGYSYKLNKLQYQATIDLSDSAINYSKLYVAGIVGRLLGIREQSDYLTNYGDISIYQKTNTETYVCGIMNVDIITPNSQSANTPVSKNPLESKGAYYFYGASFTNKCDIAIANGSTNLHYTQVLNNNAGNRYITNLSGLYNLQTANDISLSMDKISSFAPVLNNMGGATSYPVKISTAYNFKNINITMDANVTSNVTYAGFALGEHVNYLNVHNLGNITATVNYQIGANNNAKTVIISGITKEVSEGCYAHSIYNKGNILVNYTANVYADVYASGICYVNKNGFTADDIKRFDPSSDKFESGAIGSLNDCINNGNVIVTNPNYASLSIEGRYDVKSANGSVITENLYYPQNAPTAKLVGDINVTGVANFNYSAITNTFNLADMLAANYIISTVKNEINASGLVTYNIGQFAVIENSANNGVIKAINLSFYCVFNNGQTSINTTTAQYAFVNSSGILCHNDETDSGATYSNGGTHSKQIIAFTINYGSIYSYNIARNSTTSSASQFRTISAGILGMGLLNLVNVVNYGNIYGSEVSGGIVGVMFFDSFNTEVTASNKVTLANTINYANVLLIDKGELHYRDNKYVHQDYSSFLALDNSSTVYYVSIPVYARDYFNGSIFGIINFSGSSNAVNVIIRYLISFNKDVSLVGAEAQTPVVDVDLSTFYSAYITYDGTYTLDTYINRPVMYAPLSIGSEVVNGTTYYGVFNERFQFRQAMNGNEAYLDILNHPTDSFITDYFEFIGATYVNEHLLNTIGWGAIAFDAAAETFATNLEAVSKFVNYLENNVSNQYNALVTNALNTDTWLSKISQENLLKIVDELITKESSEELLAIIRYVFSSQSTSYSILNSTARVNLLNLLLENDDTLDYASLLDNIIVYNGGYAAILADAVLSDNDAGEYLKDYLSSLPQTTIKNILVTYCEYLNSNATNAYFSYSNSVQRRFDVLNAIFNSITEPYFYESLASVLGITNEVATYNMSDEIAMYAGLRTLDDTQLALLYRAIILNNSFANISTYINSMSSEIDYYVRLINSGYLKTSLTNIYSDVSADATSSTTSVIDERVALWNQIRNTNVFNTFLSSKFTEYVAKATEVNNTYQTTTYPYPSADSSYGDLSFTYTFNITPLTYFLGPYTNKNKSKNSFTPVTSNISPTNGDSNSTLYSVVDVATKAEADWLYTQGYTYNYQLFYYEYSDSSSNNQFCAVNRPSDNSIYAFTWFKTSNTTDFTGGFLNGTYDANGDWNPEPFYVTDTAGVTFDINGGGISKFTSNSSQSSGSTNSIHINASGSWVITDANNKTHNFTGTVRNWADFIIAHEVRHYVAYPTSLIHSTNFSGLIRRRGESRWFTFNSNGQVKASQYIDYNVDQLCALDGYLTSYGDGTTVSQDERTIINDIFNSYFVNNSTNRTAFKNMVAAALLEKNSIINNDSYYYVGTPTYNNKNKVYYTLTASLADSYDTTKKYYNRVLTGGHYNYLEVDINKVNSTNYSSYYFVEATRILDYYNNNQCYQMREVDDYDISYINDFMVTNIYTSTKINSNKPFVYLNQATNVTVEAYLKSLVTEVTKNDFIAYCVSHQDAYAKFILTLLAFDEMNSSSSLSFPYQFGNSTDPGAVAISEFTAYSGLAVQEHVASIEGSSFNYGYTFSSVDFDLNSTDTKVYLYVAPLNNSGTLGYSLDSGAVQYATISQAQVYEINILNNTSIELTSSQNVVLYQIDLGGAVTTIPLDDIVVVHNEDEFDAWGGNVGSLSPGDEVYQLPTSAQVLSIIQNKIEQAGISYVGDITFQVEMHATSMCNSGGPAHEGRYHRIILNTTGNKSSLTNATEVYTFTTLGAKNQRNTYNGTISNSDLGKYVGVIVSKEYFNFDDKSQLAKALGLTQAEVTGLSQAEALALYEDRYYAAANSEYKYYNTLNGAKTKQRIKLFDLSLSLTCSFNGTRRANALSNSSILSYVLEDVNFTPVELCSSVIKIKPNYSTRFDDFVKDATYNLIPIDYSKEAYINSLTSSTYYVDNSGVKVLATKEYSATETYYTYSDGAYSVATIDEATYYASMTSNKYYTESGGSYSFASGAYDSSEIYYLYASGEYMEVETPKTNLVDIVGLNEDHDANTNPEYCVPELLERILTTSNEAFLSFFNSSVVASVNNESDYELVVRNLVSGIGHYVLADALTSISATLSTDVKEMMAAAYLVTNYSTILKNQTSVYDSYLRNYIDNSLTSDYRYIQSDDSYDKDKFEAFAQLIGYSLSTTGYGIYALASSYGIKDGRFIPDNLVLSSMNPYYTKNGNDYILTSTTNSYWRRGSGALDDATTDQTSVNYAFFEEMKQLKKSISTAIIELDLTDGTNTYMSNSNQTSVKNNDGEITYYITESELSGITTSLTISELVIANRATLYLVNGTTETLYNKDTNKTIPVTKNGNSLTTTYKLKVVAEETTVYTYYDIKFVILPSTDTYTLLYSDDTVSKTYTYTGGTVSLKFTSNNLPKNLDLTPYITISKTGASYNYLEDKDLFLTYFSYYTYGKYQVTDADGDAKIKLEVFQKLPAGTYTIKVQIGSLFASVELVKTASSERDIVEFEFDNATVSLSGTAYTSNILYGRTFNKADLEVPAGSTSDVKPAYLSKFDISPNATYQATATYEYDNVTHLVRYIVTYHITSESGVTKEYTHTLIEGAPYQASETFATEYMNGDIYNSSNPSYSLAYTTTSVDANNVLSADSSIIISFSRDEGAPEFRTYYNLSHFYITEDNFSILDVSNTYSSIGSGSGVAAVSAPYAGITATITKACDVGTYVFSYTYTSESTWGSDTLERKYVFPLIYITKEASTDSWISNISFLDNYLSEGSNATKLTYQNALIPNENTIENRTTYHYASGEVYYQGYSNSQGITINTSGDLTYQAASKVSNQNYYVLGNVSDASLSSYAPTMTINSYSEVYQYLTEEKADGTYGIGQITNDTALLTTQGNTTIYLYVPYYVDNDNVAGESAQDEYEIFLVKMVVSQTGVKSLTEVFLASDGIYTEVDDTMVRNAPKYTFTGLTLADIHSTSNSFAYDNKVYKVSEFAGQPGNSSLYMNYIGNPEDGHFWYVSYAVFSESYLKSATDTTHVDFYHISIIDLTNNIYFTIKVNVPTGFDDDAIFMTLNYVTYDTLGNPKENAVSIYAIVDSEGGNLYIPQYELSMLPSGYYTFTMELAPGYKVSYTASRLNNISSAAATYADDHEGAYFPPSSVVPIQIDLVFTVEVDSNAISTTNLWGMGTSSTETVKATYFGAAATITQKNTEAEVGVNLVNLVSSTIRGTYVFKLNGTTVTTVSSGQNSYDYVFTPNDVNYISTSGTITVIGTE